MRGGILVVGCLAVGLDTSVHAATIAVTSTATCTDVDGDGFCADQDCDDTDSTVYPGASQACNGKNNDCDHPEWPGLAYTNEVDDDRDGFSDCAGDCNDASTSVRPGGPEACNSYDDDCDGVLDNSPTPALPADEADLDGDTYMVCAGDCNDHAVGVHPGVMELCKGPMTTAIHSPTTMCHGVDSDGTGVQTARDN